MTRWRVKLAKLVDGEHKAYYLAETGSRVSYRAEHDPSYAVHFTTKRGALDAWRTLAGPLEGAVWKGATLWDIQRCDPH